MAGLKNELTLHWERGRRSSPLAVLIAAVNHVSLIVRFVPIGPGLRLCDVPDQTHIALGLKPPLLKHLYRVGCCANDLPPTGFPAKPPQQTKRERSLLLGQIAGRPSKEKWCVREVTAELQPGFEPIGGPVSEC